jgi:hypothetical protein
VFNLSMFCYVLICDSLGSIAHHSSCVTVDSFTCVGGAYAPLVVSSVLFLNHNCLSCFKEKSVAAD